METIKNYLDNIFKTLPMSDELFRLKNEIFGDMEAKYHELRQMGSTENEAIGKVISEFGNIDELISEFGISTSPKENLPIVSIDKAREFLSLSLKASLFIGCGVAIILFGVSMFIGLYTLFETNRFLPSLSQDLVDILPVILLLVMIIPAVGLFIYSDTLLKKYKFIELAKFELDSKTKYILQEEVNTFAPKRTLSTIIGVSLCILSAVVLLIVSGFDSSYSSYGVSLLLIIVSIAVFIFIYFGGIQNSYDKLLKSGDFAFEEKQNDKVLKAVSAIVWPIIVCIFLLSGFLYNMWYINWIVFPITGILFGAFSSLYSILKNK